eukprot:scaffold11580_cov18-Tisochrysis_lutea.AAC.1
MHPSIQSSIHPVIHPSIYSFVLSCSSFVHCRPCAGGLGLTALIAADKDPYRSWAKYLAGINAQAAVVADSPFYKLLIGRMLGYDEDNIRHHIKARP